MERLEKILHHHGFYCSGLDLGDRYFSRDTGPLQRLVSFQKIRRKGYWQIHSTIALHVTTFEQIWTRVQPSHYVNHPIFGLLSSNAGRECFPISYDEDKELKRKLETYVTSVTSLLESFPLELTELKREIGNENLGRFRLEQFDSTNIKTKMFLSWLESMDLHLS